jgi:hypothetical protein
VLLLAAGALIAQNDAVAGLFARGFARAVGAFDGGATSGFSLSPPNQANAALAAPPPAAVAGAVSRMLSSRAGKVMAPPMRPTGSGAPTR